MLRLIWDFADLETLSSLHLHSWIMIWKLQTWKKRCEITNTVCEQQHYHNNWSLKCSLKSLWKIVFCLGTILDHRPKLFKQIFCTKILRKVWFTLAKIGFRKRWLFFITVSDLTWKFLWKLMCSSPPPPPPPNTNLYLTLTRIVTFSSGHMWPEDYNFNK